jgi:tol-pal system protein YbgF
MCRKLATVPPIAYAHRMVRSVTAFAAVLACGLPPLIGCAGETAEERQLADLSRGVERDQSWVDRTEPRINEKEQLAKVPAISDSVPRGGNAARQGDGSETMPEPSELDGEDPNDTTPRPVIRIVGVRPARRGVPGLDHIDETLPDEPANGGQAGPPIRANAPSPSALNAEAKRSYDAALALVNGHQYDQALDAFAAFLVRWPDHPNADNAMYWRGESYYAKGEYARAAEEFEGATLRFPLGNKVPDCLLKLGLCQQKLGNQEKAKSYFDRLSHDFPRSEAAHRIPDGRTRSAGPQESP